MINKIKDPVKRHNNSHAMQGIFASASLNNSQSNVLQDTEVLVGLNSQHMSKNISNPKYGKECSPFTSLGYQEDTTYDSPSIYGGGRGGQKYLDIQDQTMEKLAHMTPDKTSLNKVSHRVLILRWCRG